MTKGITMTERYQRVRMDDLRHMKLFEKAKTIQHQQVAKEVVDNDDKKGKDTESTPKE